MFIRFEDTFSTLALIGASSRYWSLPMMMHDRNGSQTVLCAKGNSFKIKRSSLKISIIQSKSVCAGLEIPEPFNMPCYIFRVHWFKLLRVSLLQVVAWAICQWTVWAPTLTVWACLEWTWTVALAAMDTWVEICLTEAPGPKQAVRSLCEM